MQSFARTTYEIECAHKRAAVLVFADAPGLDLARRQWPHSFQTLLRTQQLDAEWSGGVDIHLFTTVGLALPSLLPQVTVHKQRGASFAERLENAVGTLAQLAYDRVVIVGRDCPDLEAEDIVPVSTLSSSAFGRFVNNATAPRIVQFALKVTF